MRIILSALSALGLAFITLPTPTLARDSENPLIGSWTWQPEGTNCKEVYEWRANGTGHVTSGKEISETRFKVSDTPDENGFYVFIDQVIKENRGKDCGGSTKDNTGEKTTLYVRMNTSGDQIQICLKPLEKACFGPLMRIPVLEI